MMAKALRNREPDAVGRKRQRAVLAEGDMHGVDQWMTSAARTGDIKSGAPLLFYKIDRRIRDRLFSFGKDQDSASKSPIQAICQTLGPNGLLGRGDGIDGKCDSRPFPRYARDQGPRS